MRRAHVVFHLPVLLILSLIPGPSHVGWPSRRTRWWSAQAIARRARVSPAQRQPDRLHPGRTPGMRRIVRSILTLHLKHGRRS